MLYFQKVTKWIKAHYLVIIGLLLTGGFVYSEIFFKGQKLAFTNILYTFQPFDSLGVAIKGPLLSDVADNMQPIAYHYLHKFNLGFWMSDLGIGVPQSMSTYLNVFNYIYLLPFEFAVFLISLSKFLLAFLGLYLLSREYGNNRISSFAGGIVYTFSSALLAWHGWPHSGVAMLAPFLFYLIEKYLKSLQIKYLFFMILILTTMLFVGMPVYVAYFIYLLGFYTLIFGFIHYRKEPKRLLLFFAGFAAVILFAALLSSSYTVELLNSVGSNGYSSSRQGQAGKTLPLYYIQSLFFPYIREGYGHHFNESALYTGIFAIFIIPATFFVENKRKAYFWLGSTCVLFVLIFSNLLTPIFKLLPLINTSLKYRVIVLLNFSIAILFSLNINNFFKHPDIIFRNKKKYFLLFLATFSSIFVVMYSMDNEVIMVPDVQNYIKKLAFLFIGLFIASTLIVFLKSRRLRHWSGVLLCVLLIVDMAGFAKEYLPLIEGDAKMIPDATETIQYLQKNTENQEKMVALGDWTFFASQNLFYDLRDIRMHSFVATNADIMAYYKEIDPDSFTSATRIAFQNIENENLLKYMGVKYIVKPDPSIQNQKFSNEELVVGPPFFSGTPLKQSFTADQSDLSLIKVMLITYERTFTTEMLTFKLIDEETQETVREEQLPLNSVMDNSIVTFEFPAVENSKDRRYTLEFTSDVTSETPLSLYVVANELYEGDLIVGDQQQESGLFMYPIYTPKGVYWGNENLITTELDEYSSQFELVENVEFEKTESDILAAMKQNYAAHQLYLLAETEAELTDKQIVTSDKLEKTEQITVEEQDKNGYAKVTVETAKPRMILMNEYNDGNWKAFVNGEETKILKGNYLYRAVTVPAGKSVVEFKYYPSSIVKMLYLSVGTLVVLLVTFLFRNKIQSLIDRIKTDN